MIYENLSIPFRSLIILGLFLNLCIGCCLIVATVRRKQLRHVALISVLTVTSGALMILYTAEARARLRQLTVPEVSRWLCSQSFLIPVAIWLVIFIVFMYLVVQHWNFSRNTISRSSIKEGIDQISSGLCFYTDNGRVLLMNSRMNELSFLLTGQDLQNAQLFWDTISGGDVLPAAQRLSYGSRPNFRLADGSVWTFQYERLNGFHQLLATNTTQIQSITDELSEKNIALAALNLRLRQYGENVDALTRSRERLETKVRIHGELGQALMATRRYLMDADAMHPPLEQWKHSIAMLRKEAGAQKGEDPMDILSKAAQTAGIRLHVHGQLQHTLSYRRLFLLAASEAMTNAVFHANAKNLFIHLTEDESTWQMRFTNDGTAPKAPITEGGGLSALRHKAKSIQAQMTVDTDDGFALILRGRKGKNDDT
jgi:hypothetical protein